MFRLSDSRAPPQCIFYNEKMQHEQRIDLGEVRRYPQSHCHKPANSQEELLHVLWRKLLNIQVIFFPSSLFSPYIFQHHLLRQYLLHPLHWPHQSDSNFFKSMFPISFLHPSSLSV